MGQSFEASAASGGSRRSTAGQVRAYAYDERDGLFQVKDSPDTWTDPAAPPAGV
jgi:hypothetical protein